MNSSWVDMMGPEEGRKSMEELHQKIAELSVKEEELEKWKKMAEEKDTLVRVKDAEISMLRRRKAPASFGCLDEVQFDFRVPLNSITKDGVLSDSHTVGGIPFGARVSTTEDNQHLSLHVLFNKDSTSKTWRARADYALGLLSSEWKWNRYSWEDDITFDHSNTCKGSCTFIEWKHIVDVGRQYIDNGFLTLHARVKLISCEIDAVTDFALSTDVTDVTLMIEGTAIHASLAACSTYFKALFMSDSATFILELPKFPENLQAEHFEEMLRIVYPERKQVTKDNVEYLLALADFFDIDVVLKECEAFLEKSEDFSSAKKVLLAEKFRLHHLCYSMARHLDNVDRVKEVVEANEFNELSDSFKSGILKKFYELKK